MNLRDDFLADPEGAPDAELQHLERLLSAYHRDPPELPALPPRQQPAASPRVWLAAAAAVVVVGIAALIWRSMPSPGEQPVIAREDLESAPSLPAPPSPIEDGPSTFAPPLASEPADCTAPGDQGAFLAVAPATDARSCASLSPTDCEQRDDCRVVRGERYRPADVGWCRERDEEVVGCVATPESCTYSGTASVGVGDDKQYWEVDGCLPGWVPCDLPEGSVTVCEPAP